MSTLKANRYENTSTSDGGINIDSSGRVLVGVSSSYANSNADDLQIGSNSSSTETGITLGSTLGSGIRFADSGSTSAGIIEYSHGTDYMRFVTNASEVMRLDSSGNLGIGNTNPSDYASGAENLVVGDTSSANGITILSGTSNSGGINFADGTGGTDRGRLDYDHGDDRMRFYTASSERLRIKNTGQTFIQGTAADGVLNVNSTQGAATNKNLIVGGHSSSGITSGTACFVVLTNGNVLNTNGSYGSLSDAKLKENIVDASSQWDDIKAIQVRNYNFKESTGYETHRQLGVVAQELETVSPGLVSDSPDLDADGNDLGTVTKSVNYSVLYMKSVKALQEAMTRIEALEAKVAALEAA